MRDAGTLIAEAADAITADLEEHPLISLRDATRWEISRHRAEWLRVLSRIPVDLVCKGLLTALVMRGARGVR